MQAVDLANDLWRLTKGNPWIDPTDLAAALDRACQSDQLDYRSKLLARESLLALRQRWGESRLMQALSIKSRRLALELLENDPEEVGFPTLSRRIQDRTETNTILRFLRELGDESGEAARLEIGGSTALILHDLLRRATDDIDVVNEVPSNLRSKYELLSRLTARHNLQLTHFQSRYLPNGYQDRLHYLDRFGSIDVYLVDPLDIFVGKLFSRRDKDRTDLTVLQSRFEPESILDRFKSSTADLMSDPECRENAKKNWYVLFGKELGVI